jgi:FkbM family methyltransferase
VARVATRWVYQLGYPVLGRDAVKQFPPVRFMARRIAATLREPTAVVDGHDMLLDPVDSLRLSIVGVYEPFETSLVKKLLRPGDVAVDVGANIGYYTLLFARAVGPEGRVIAFEPEPTNFAILERNVKVNGYEERVHLVQAACGPRSGTTKLFLSDSNMGDHTLLALDDRTDRSVDVEETTLDDVVADVDLIRLLKVDVQGGEMGVMAGAPRTLGNTEVLVSEYSPWRLTEAGLSPGALLEEIRRAGFRIDRIDEPTRRLTPVGSGLTESANLICRRPGVDGAPSG